ncbi:hypothetical protein F5B20DRAFT_556049 [Whalleya microplaca]|nr:hypothetical protein F5B20DRAFT_556049 [Whalleya microplaca]
MNDPQPSIISPVEVINPTGQSGPQIRPSPPVDDDRSALRTAQKEARQAVLEAVEKLKKVSTESSIDLYNEFEALWDAAVGIPTLTSILGVPSEGPFLPSAPRILDIFESEEPRPREIERLSMDDWRLDESGQLQKMRPGHILPVIQAFYRNVPPASETSATRIIDEDFKRAHNDSQGTEKPQRVKISSRLVLNELEKISGITLRDQPHLMIPPYKLLIHNWDGIKLTLGKLTEELENLTPPEEGRKSPRKSAASTTENITHQQDLQDKPEEDVNSERRRLKLRVSHLKCLHDFITTDLGYLIGLKLKIQDGSLGTITFEELYHLYSPGDLIINRKNNVDQLHKVYAVTGGRMRLLRQDGMYRRAKDEEDADNSPDAGIGTWTDFVLDCFMMRWDGNRLGPIRRIYRVQHFTGERPITDLDLYPVKFRENSDEICKALERRGRSILDCFGHKKYDGLTTVAPPYREGRSRTNDRGMYSGLPPSQPPPIIYDPLTTAGASIKEIDNDVYIDFQAFHRISPVLFDQLKRVKPSLREVAEGRVDYHTGDHDVDEVRSDKFLSDHFYITLPKKPEELEDKEEYLKLLPHSVPGYEFRQREWVWLDVNKIEDIDKSEEARARGWEDLVINKGYSQLLLSLVDNHTSASDHKRRRNASGHKIPTAQIDLIKGKGRGLIILLYGPPGSGKTSTAETIAAYTGKPLYAITCGDIGVNVQDVERNLHEHTQRAEKWGCVLLLDEADVFLARRTWTDMNRNALVSIFLRHMEYYSGILFLTTNIVGIIDEAFKSRIHIALRYDAIDIDSTEHIWTKLLNRIEKENKNADVQIKFNRDVLLEFAQKHFEEHQADETTWNARQIRNAFSTAISIGQFERLERIKKKGLTPDEVEKLTKGLMTVKLTSRNFSRIAEAAADFEEYITAVRGPDRDNALESKQRNDYFGRQLAAPRKKYRQQGEEFQASRRQGYVTPPTSRSARGKKTARMSVYMDEEEDDEDDEDFGAGEPGPSKKKPIKDDDSEEEDW